MRKYINQKKFEVLSFLIGIFLGTLFFPAPLLQAAFITTPPITSGTLLQTSASGISTSTISTTLRVNANSVDAGFFLSQNTAVGNGDIMTAISGDILRFKITKDGKIGIATTTPGKILSVQGDVNISGNLDVANLTATGTTRFGSGPSYTWPSAEGTSGQGLQTNGAGVLSWATVSTTQFQGTFTSDLGVALGTPMILNNGAQRVESFDPSSYVGEEFPIIGYVNVDIYAWSFQETTAFDASILFYKLKKAGAPTDNFTLSIEGDTAGAPNGTPIVSTTFSGTTLTTSFVEKEFVFATTTFAANTKYWVVMDRSGAADDANNYVTSAETSSSYTNGICRYQDEGVWANNPGCDFNIKFMKWASAGNVLPGSAVETASATRFVGLANAAMATGTAGTINIAGIQTGLSGLSIGSIYYLQNATGTQGLSAGTVSQKTCKALSATSCLINSGF